MIRNIFRSTTVRGAFAVFSAFTVSVAEANAASEPGVHSDRIIFGQSAPLDGPAKELGLAMQAGLKTAFAEQNAKGGVNGRKIELITYNDGYEPDAAGANVTKLINEDAVFAIIGSVGTPTAKVAQPIAKSADVPYIAPMTGAGFLRDPSNRHVVNLRASYAQETEMWVERLTKDRDAKKIAVLYQADSFGQAGLDGVTSALERRGMQVVAAEPYRRNSRDVRRAVVRLQTVEPDAIAIVGAYAPAAEFIDLASRVELTVPMMNISFVGSRALAATLEAHYANVVVSQVVPSPSDESVPLVKQYRAALSKFGEGAQPDFVSLEGYLAGRFAIAALERAGAAPTRDGFLSSVYDGAPYDIGGLKFVFGDGDNQGGDGVFLTVLDESDEFVPISSLSKL